MVKMEHSRAEGSVEPVGDVGGLVPVVVGNNVVIQQTIHN
jgi:hypothetical protein